MCFLMCAAILLGISLRGTFAWFYGEGEESAAGPFTTAKVELVKTVENVQIFQTNQGQSLFNQISNYNNDFYAWWNAVQSNFTDITASGVIGRGCVVIQSYTFENASNIPVYFRIYKAVLTAAPSVIFGMVFDPNPYLAVESGDYCYYLEPLMPPPDPFSSGDSVTVEFFICIPQNTPSFSLADWHAESIQATNNAVYFADGWRDVSGWIPVP